jgi:hypothetical protein
VSDFPTAEVPVATPADEEPAFPDVLDLLPFEVSWSQPNSWMTAKELAPERTKR